MLLDALPLWLKVSSEAANIISTTQLRSIGSLGATEANRNSPFAKGTDTSSDPHQLAQEPFDMASNQ
ncbi:hypothetical protein [Paraburkholderia aspalathi]|uniref:hypothetical protein n=1 Tax=Paraburkholderia aspalathi TaxID=1324617 RepID=UPI001FCA009F|nr:hypothetical protein [Paraburkholderia aspalathi]